MSKKIDSLNKDGYSVYDMSMDFHVDKPTITLWYLPATDTVRLEVLDEAVGFSRDAAAIASTQDLPGTMAVVKAINTRNAYQRGIVDSIFIHAKGSGRSAGNEFGFNFKTLKKATKDSGWPDRTFIGILGPSIRAC
jgi:hypothetical protein